MAGNDEIIARLARIEAMLERISPPTLPIEQEARAVVAQGKNLAAHLRDKYRRNRKERRMEGK